MKFSKCECFEETQGPPGLKEASLPSLCQIIFYELFYERVCFLFGTTRNEQLLTRSCIFLFPEQAWTVRYNLNLNLNLRLKTKLVTFQDTHTWWCCPFGRRKMQLLFDQCDIRFDVALYIYTIYVLMKYSFSSLFTTPKRTFFFLVTLNIFFPFFYTSTQIR